VLITNDYHAKLCDFGLSKIKHDIKSRSNTGTSNILGTLLWMAPELITEEKTNNPSTDIYSYSMTMWEIAARKKPFAGKNPAIQAFKIASGARETIPAETPLNYAKLIKKCWDQRAEKRPTATQVVEELTALKL
jgi:serine/threonine protein kinase